MKIQEQLIIKQAIQRIYIRNQVNIENLLALEEGLQSNKITEEEWKEIFRARGSEDAIQKQIYSAQMVRLLLLQSVILPATLPKYLEWLEKREKNSEVKKIFIDFQKQLWEMLGRVNPEYEFLHLKEKLIEGVRFIIPYLVKQSEFLNPTVSLLKSQNGLWGHFYHYHVKQEIERDLTTAPQLILHYQPNEVLTAAPQLTLGYQPNEVLVLMEEPLWEELFQNIKSTWWETNRVSPKEKYLPLAQFFEKISYFKASALFYHIAWGEVPGNVFKSCQSRGGRDQKEVFGVWVRRHLTFPEQIWNQVIKIGGIILPFLLVSHKQTNDE